MSNNDVVNILEHTKDILSSINTNSKTIDKINN